MAWFRVHLLSLAGLWWHRFFDWTLIAMQWWLTSLFIITMGIEAGLIRIDLMFWIVEHFFSDVVTDLVFTWHIILVLWSLWTMVILVSGNLADFEFKIVLGDVGSLAWTWHRDSALCWRRSQSKSTLAELGILLDIGEELIDVLLRRLKPPVGNWSSINLNSSFGILGLGSSLSTPWLLTCLICLLWGLALLLDSSLGLRMSTPLLRMCWQLCIQLSWLSLLRVGFGVALRRRRCFLLSKRASLKLSWLWTGADSRWPSWLRGRCRLGSFDLFGWFNHLSHFECTIVGCDQRLWRRWTRWCLLKWRRISFFFLLERWCVWCSIDAMVLGVDVAKGVLWEDPVFEFAWEGVDVVSWCSEEWLERLLLWCLILSRQIWGTDDSENHSEVHHILLWKMTKLKETWLILRQRRLTESKVTLQHIVSPWERTALLAELERPPKVKGNNS